MQRAKQRLVNIAGVTTYLLDGVDLLNGDAYRTGWRAVQPVALAAGTHTLHVPFTTSGSTANFQCALRAYTGAEANPLQLVLREGDGVSIGRRPTLRVAPRASRLTPLCVPPSTQVGAQCCSPMWWMVFWPLSSRL